MGRALSEDLYPRDKRIVSVTYVTRISFSELNKMYNITDLPMGLIGPSKWRAPRLTRLRKWTHLSLTPHRSRPLGMMAEGNNRRGHTT